MTRPSHALPLGVGLLMAFVIGGGFAGVAPWLGLGLGALAGSTCAAGVWQALRQPTTAKATTRLGWWVVLPPPLAFLPTCYGVLPALIAGLFTWLVLSAMVTTARGWSGVPRATQRRWAVVVLGVPMAALVMPIALSLASPRYLTYTSFDGYWLLGLVAASVWLGVETLLDLRRWARVRRMTRESWRITRWRPLTLEQHAHAGAGPHRQGALHGGRIVSDLGIVRSLVLVLLASGCMASTTLVLERLLR